jgi:hypothetical protein
MEPEAQTRSLKEGSAAKRGRESSGKKVSQYIYSLLVLKYPNLGTTISNLTSIELPGAPRSKQAPKLQDWQEK